MKGRSSGTSSSKNREELVDVVFSWSIDDIFNEDLYKNQVERIPDSFESVEHYLNSFCCPLLEDARAELSSKLESISSSPYAQVISLDESKHRKMLYDVKVNWRSSSNEPSRMPFTGDIVVLTEAKPETISDFRRFNRTWSFGCITKISGDNDDTLLRVKVPKELEVEGRFSKLLYVVFITNITTNNRIWDALHSFGDAEVIKEVVCTNSTGQENCNMCPLEGNAIWTENFRLESYLDDSQLDAVVASISKMQCNHKSNVELIWGPPGTGKTRTVSVLVWSLLRMKYRTLACAPTNVAITEVASRVLKLVKDSVESGRGTDDLSCCLGDILVFGNMGSTSSDVEEIYLDYRVKKLAECFGEVNGWKCCFTSMIEFLENCASQYNTFCENEQVRMKEDTNETEACKSSKSFLKFVRDRFRYTAIHVKSCVNIICTHLPKSFITEQNFKNMVRLVALIDSFKMKLSCENLSEELNEVFLYQRGVESSNPFVNESRLLYLRNECLCELRALLCSLGELDLPSTTNRGSIEEFCFQMASLIFCTASNSYRLRLVAMQPMKLLVIDEASQLKESESIIPLELSGIRHVILIGDECQLPAMVNSNVSEEAGFARSLFERLSLLGHAKHLLNIQYRMHPLISFFPNAKFYEYRMIDAPMVKSESYTRRYLSGSMFGPYSFINVSGGREVFDDRNSRKNLVEVAVVLKIIQLLFKACDAEESKRKIGIMVVSPYSAQVAEIQYRLGQKYENHVCFTVKVRSIDGCQGGEEDIVIVSTVRSNRSGSIGFTSNPNRTNVALTRARHCLWILGNEKTLINSGSVWEDLVLDAKVRQCLYDADESKELGKVIMDVKKELDQLDDFLNSESILFKKARWKVIFSDNFRRSFLKLKSAETKTLVLLHLSKLSSGWRPKRGNVSATFESFSGILKSFMVRGLYIIASIDIVKESWYIQALKVWDILPLHDIPKLVKRLENIFGMYTEDFLNRCRFRCVQGFDVLAGNKITFYISLDRRDLEIPMTWPPSTDIVQYKSLSNIEPSESSKSADLNGKKCIENTKVRDSLLLMKFYSLSTGVVNNLLSGCDGRELGLPFELTEQEQEIVHFSRSTFVLGRSGTGKTTVLTMKLFQNEQLHHIASEGFHEVRSNPSKYVHSESDGEGKEDILHQIFLTVSPKLCYAVKQHISQMKRSVCGGSSSSESSSVCMDDINDVAQFTDIPDSFVHLPPKLYPLVITFRKFMLMLDGTVGISYFDRFPDVRGLFHGNGPNSRSIALETFIRTKEVNFDRFCSYYWPHFNYLWTRKLDPSKVFTEIMSVIKGGGGLQTGKATDANVSREEYILLSNNRASSLSTDNRETIYDIFVEYEKKKRMNSEFDLADLVIDIHRRLKDNGYEGDEMDFVYVDEVQDLSMRQIALFKYISRNVEEGFAFCGDTAQTIAKGIDFRFEDIRSLFYNEFLIGEKREVADKIKKGQVSRIFHLRQNFRTHDGILKLAQSIINLIYHFFPSSIDILSPETSLLPGEAPILLKTKENENSVKMMFENTETFGGHVTGFGAEQVILVRDERLRKEVCDYVEKKALVLTIVECKGLEFEDVLLYNFFTSSPFRNQWRVIYEYMKEKELHNPSSHMSFTSFNQEKHGGLCSELKQLYVAITRTKQRLWIWEDEFSGPVVDYWLKLCLVEVRELDHSFIKEIYVASSQEEWKSRGVKLFHENNYEMAIMCFERAGDLHWQRLAEASGLRAAADRMRLPDPEKSRIYIKNAAEIFDSIGKHELAAQSFFEINEYERAGSIYMEKFGESKLKKAGECFSLAKRYKLAAEVYARARLYSKSLSACIDGKLFALGLQYIQEWKSKGALCGEKVVEMEITVQNLLERGALHYYELKDNRTMLKFVRSFNSKELMRIILKNLKCLDELILLESEWGNFIEAANIAKMKGDSLLEADLLEKAGLFGEASMLILWFVFTHSLRQLRSKCRTLKQLMQKEEILEKAKSIAKKHSALFYEFVCVEAEILSRGKTTGEVIEFGLQFVQNWKKNAPTGLERVKASHELTTIEQELLERCARYYHDRKDNESMMRYVSSFQSIDLRRAFLKSLNCLDELLLLEEEQGNFLEASEIAEQKGDLLCKSNLLEKSGNFKEASEVILWYVLAESLWALGSEGWPLKQFSQKDELLMKAKSYAKNHSDFFYTSVCMEVDVLSNQESSLLGMSEYLSIFQSRKSLSGEILTSWRILDYHLNTMPAKYEWNDILVNDLMKNSEDTIYHKRVSIETLVYFWNYWKQNILKVIEYLRGYGMYSGSEYKSYEEFCLNYFGVRKYHGSEGSFYVVVNSNAKWVKKIGSSLLRVNGYLVRVGARQFFQVALDYWLSELLRVGIRVLVTLKSLHEHSAERKFSLFDQSICLIRVFEIAKFLQNYNFPNCKKSDTWTIKKYHEQSTVHLFGNIFHVDCRNSMTEDMVYLRGTKICMDVLEEAILGNMFMKNSKPSYGQMGRVVMMILASGKRTFDVFDKIMRSFDGKLLWRKLFDTLSENTRPISDFSGASNGNLLVYIFKDVMVDTYFADWRTEHDYISPACFLYLLERLLILAAHCRGCFFTTRSSCVEWLIYEDWSVDSTARLENDLDLTSAMGDIYDFMAVAVQELFLNRHDTMQWISMNNLEGFHHVLFFRLVVLLCLICVNSGKHFDILFKLLDRSDVRSELPPAFLDALQRRGGCYIIEALAEALSKFDNPLVMVSSAENLSKSKYSNAIFLIVNVKNCCEDILRELFPYKPVSITSYSDDQKRSLGSPLNNQRPCESSCPEKKYGLLWEIFDALRSLENGSDENLLSMEPSALVLKVEVDKISDLLSVRIASSPQMRPLRDQELYLEVNSMLTDLKQLSLALDFSENQFKDRITTIVVISKKLWMRRPRLEHFLDHILLQDFENDVGETLADTIKSDDQ
ncbi:hypothetical protein LguiA_000798 [Lonicera macranthoides]